MSLRRVGNDQFYLESFVDSYLPDIGQMAIGYFSISIDGRAYGVKRKDASLLACSYDAVVRRLKASDSHRLSFGDKHPAHFYVHELLRAHLGDSSYQRCFTDEEREEFVAKLFSHELWWAPDGDAAFDDGSYVIQMDYPNYVRVIGFKYLESQSETLASISELRMDSGEFYDVLEEWSGRFLEDWRENTPPNVRSH
jgi:hypothetical protein